MSAGNRRRRIQGVADAYIERQAYSGIEWLVHRGGREWERGRAGHADAVNGTAMAEKPLYRIYSMTKPVVSAAALMLMEEGRLRLYDPIAAYLPEFRKMEVFDGEETRPCKMPILIEHLFTHRAGFSYGFLPDCPVGSLYRDTEMLDGGISLARMVEIIAAQPLAFLPGSAWRYSVATDVLARVIEVITEMPLAEVLAERLFRPLAMGDTGFMVAPGERHRVMAMFGTTSLDEVLNFSGEPQTLTPADVSAAYPDDDAEFARGGHGLFSTADDYMTFCEFLAGGLAPTGERLLARKTVELMWTNRVPEEQRPLAIGPVPLPGYGYGLAGRVMVDAGRAMSLTSIGECGWAGAASTFFWIDRAEDVIGVVMAQYLGAQLPLADDLRSAVYQALDD